MTSTETVISHLLTRPKSAPRVSLQRRATAIELACTAVTSTPTSGADPASVVDLDRYPIADLTTDAARRVIDAARADLARDGVAIFPGFVRAEVVAQMARGALALKP